MFELKGKLSAIKKMSGVLNNAEVKIYPELEDITITPSAKEQHYKSVEKYGYNNIIVLPKQNNLQDKTIKENGKYMADEGFDGLRMVNVEIPTIDINEYFDFSKEGTFIDSLIKVPQINIKNKTSLSSYFKDCTSLITINTIDTTNVTNMTSMFSGCTALIAIPKLNTSNVTSANSMFSGCINLINVPILDLSKLSFWGIANMFSNCNSLSDESLNNILAMFITASGVASSYKTLKNAGLTSEQAIKCTTLSNYSAFTSAGWTTGY